MTENIIEAYHEIALQQNRAIYALGEVPKIILSLVSKRSQDKNKIRTKINHQLGMKSLKQV